MTSMPDDNGSDEVDLRRILQVTWANKNWIAGCSALFLFFAGFYLANAPYIFEADALLQLEQRSSQLALPSALSDFMDGDTTATAEVEIVASRLVLAQVVAELNLDWIAEPVRMPLIGNALMRYDLPFPNTGFLRRYGRKGDAISLKLLEVPPDWLMDDLILTAKADGAFEVALPDGSTLEGKAGAMLRDAARGLALEVETLVAEPGRQFRLQQMNERLAVENLRSHLKVSETGRQSYLLEARFTDQNPKKAARILDAITKAYVRQNIDRSAAEAESSLAFIEDQLPKAKSAVEVAEKALNDYRQAQQSVDLSFETSNVLEQITRIETELRDLQVKEDDIKQRYRPSHPLYQQLLTQRQRLEESLALAEKQVEALPETQREVLNLTSNLELARQIYTELQTRAQEVRVLRASTVGNVRIIDVAEPGIRAVSPRRALVLAFALVLGAIVGAVIGIVKYWLRRTIQGTEALERLGLPVFATINQSKVVNGATGKPGISRILALADPTDLSVEGLRSLRTSLQFGMLDAKSNSLAVTSTAPGAGKSFTSVNLAVVSAQAGQTVCLVDADMRRGQLRKMFGRHKNEPGLSEYLAGEKTLDEVLVKTEVEGLMLISTGRYPPNPSELLMRRTLGELVEALDQRFGMSIFDCPPVLAVTDPVIVGARTGGILAVARYDQTPTAEVSAMLKVFESSGLKLTGTILNGFDPSKARAGGYSYNYNYRYEYKSRAKD